MTFISAVRMMQKPIAAGGGLSLELADYTGDGSSPGTVTPSNTSDLVFVVGTPSSGVLCSALAHNGSGVQERSAVSTTANNQLSNGGSSFSVDGTGTKGLNQNTSSYSYASVHGGATAGTYVGDGSSSRNISLGVTPGLLLLQKDTSGSDDQIALDGSVGIAWDPNGTTGNPSTLASLSGSTLTVDGAGFNTNGTDYYWVALPTPEVSGFFTGDGSYPRTVTLAQTCKLVFIIADADAVGWVFTGTNAGVGPSFDGSVREGLSLSGPSLTLGTGCGLNDSSVVHYYYGWT